MASFLERLLDPIYPTLGHGLVLDGVLKRLRFDVDDQCAIWLDRSVRDFLVAAPNAHRK